MKITIDTNSKTLEIREGSEIDHCPLYSKKAFEVLSRIWIKVGWNQKYGYTFSWLGRPIIQLPEDMMRFQEVIYQIKPDVIIETGIAHGGSLIFSASLCKAIGKGRVIGIELEIRPQNRVAIEAHELYPLITLVEGNSVDPKIVNQIAGMIQPGETVLIVLDSNHTKNHVLAELEAYHALVTPGSYIVATDGIMQDLYDTPRGKPAWISDNPASAAKEFLKTHNEFKMEQPVWIFNESDLNENVTHWSGAWLKKKL
jgi:cephalosporin hydroxylase